jgi:hypothetical protein
MRNERKPARAPDFAPSSETPDFALSLRLRDASSGRPGGYVWQAGNEPEREPSCYNTPSPPDFTALTLHYFTTPLLRRSITAARLSSPSLYADTKTT